MAAYNYLDWLRGHVEPTNGQAIDALADMAACWLEAATIAPDAHAPPAWHAPSPPPRAGSMPTSSHRGIRTWPRSPRAESRLQGLPGPGCDGEGAELGLKVMGFIYIARRAHRR